MATRSECEFASVVYDVKSCCRREHVRSAETLKFCLDVCIARRVQVGNDLRPACIDREKSCRPRLHFLS